MYKQIKVQATGETLTFLKTAADTNGAFVEAIVTLPAGAEGPPPHKHLKQTEYFEALEGKLGLLIGNEKRVFEPGQSFEVPANTRHAFFAAGNEGITFRIVYRPALRIEWFLTEIFEAANRAKDKTALGWEGAYIFLQVRDEYVLTDIPPFVQHFILPLRAIVGKAFGFVKNVTPKNTGIIS